MEKTELERLCDDISPSYISAQYGGKYPPLFINHLMTPSNRGTPFSDSRTSIDRAETPAEHATEGVKKISEDEPDDASVLELGEKKYKASMLLKYYQFALWPPSLENMYSNTIYLHFSKSDNALKFAFLDIHKRKRIGSITLQSLSEKIKNQETLQKIQSFRIESFSTIKITQKEQSNILSIILKHTSFKVNQYTFACQDNKATPDPTIKTIFFTKNDHDKILYFNVCQPFSPHWLTGEIDFSDLFPTIRNARPKTLLNELENSREHIIRLINYQIVPAPYGYLGRGSYATARKFETNIATDDKPIVILQANLEPEKDELKAKYRFYQTAYPNEKTILFVDPEAGSYRLIVPFLEGIAYSHMSKNKHMNEIEQMKLFLAALRAINALHKAPIPPSAEIHFENEANPTSSRLSIESKQTNLVFIDLNNSNIFYVKPQDSEDIGKAQLIDGGLSCRAGQTIGETFVGELINGYRPSWFAPEAWEPEGKVSTAMDVYALGALMRDVTRDMIHRSSKLSEWTKQCCQENPDARPSLDDLETTILEYLSRLCTQRDNVYQFLK